MLLVLHTGALSFPLSPPSFSPLLYFNTVSSPIKSDQQHALQVENLGCASLSSAQQANKLEAQISKDEAEILRLEAQMGGLQAQVGANNKKHPFE